MQPQFINCSTCSFNIQLSSPWLATRFHCDDRHIPTLIQSGSFPSSLTRIQRTGHEAGGKGTNASTTSNPTCRLQGCCVCQQTKARFSRCRRPVERHQTPAINPSFDGLSLPLLAAESQWVLSWSSADRFRRSDIAIAQHNNANRCEPRVAGRVVQPIDQGSHAHPRRPLQLRG